MDYIDRLLDKLWSQIIAKRANHVCEYCGSDYNCSPHHIFSRRNRSTRWDLRIGIYLCSNHHTFDTYSAHQSKEFSEIWIKNYIGEKLYLELERKSNQIKKWTKEEKQELVEEFRKILRGK